MTKPIEDGEDTQRNPHEEAIKTLLYRSLQWEDGEIKGYNAQAVESLLPIIMRPLYQELASLREQLATEQDMRSTAEFANRMIIKDLNEKLKQKEDENRELVEILNALQPWISGIGWIHHNGDFFDMTDRIKKAKNLSASAKLGKSS